MKYKFIFERFYTMYQGQELKYEDFDFKFLSLKSRY
jgi:hypothetical protein